MVVSANEAESEDQENGRQNADPSHNCIGYFPFWLDIGALMLIATILIVHSAVWDNTLVRCRLDRVAILVVDGDGDDYTWLGLGPIRDVVLHRSRRAAY